MGKTRSKIVEKMTDREKKDRERVMVTMINRVLEK